MYEKDGEQYFIVDAHIAFWDARPENRNRLGEGFIKCFYDYHRNLGPEEYLWPFEEKFVKYTEEDLMHDLFEAGYVDHAIFQPVYLGDFYKNGFNTPEMDAPLAEKHPGLFTLNGSFDPRLGKKGLAHLESLHEQYGIKGVKLYTAATRSTWRMSTARRRTSRSSTSSSSTSGYRASRTSAGSARRSRTSTAGWRSPSRSSTPGRATSRRSSGSCCTG
jgi:hypothetical protein